jgi:hypothetical protein
MLTITGNRGLRKKYCKVGISSIYIQLVIYLKLNAGLTGARAVLPGIQLDPILFSLSSILLNENFFNWEEILII